MRFFKKNLTQKTLVAEEKKFLDKEGLTYLWSKIKSYINDTDTGWKTATVARQI